MPWLILVLAGCLEVVWAVGLKHSHGLTRLGPSALTLVALFGSFGMLALALRSIPLGTAYAIWTGIGAVGAFIAGVLFFDERVSLVRVGAVLLIVVGLFLLKVTASDPAGPGGTGG